jgi:hypothetical protein
MKRTYKNITRKFSTDFSRHPINYLEKYIINIALGNMDIQSSNIFKNMYLLQSGVRIYTKSAAFQWFGVGHP